MKKLVLFLLIVLILWPLAVLGKITIISPSKHVVWYEGKTYTIKWKGGHKGKVCIFVIMGGKDKGTVNGCQTEASKGEVKWHIPLGFVTGFGIPRSNFMRIAISNTNTPNTYAMSPYFTISGFAPVKTHSYKDTIITFFTLLNKREYRKAYYLTNKCKIVIYNCDRSVTSYFPETEYYPWRDIASRIKNIKLLRITSIKTKRDSFCYGKTLLNIKKFKTEVLIVKKNGKKLEETMFLDVIKSGDGFYHILNMNLP